MPLMVVDASVVIKWLLPQRDETDGRLAVQLWNRVGAGHLQLVQPPHWLAEVAAVVARLSPATAADDIRDLHALEIAVSHSLQVYDTACELAISLNHHLFDTLYHAVALELGARLVTADERYYTKAEERGCIVRLAEFKP